MNKKRSKKVLLRITINILLVMMFVASATADSSGTSAKADFTEGGHVETDFGVNFMAEWWYLNGEVRLVASDGEKRDLGFFVVLAHQESPMIVSPDGTNLSHLFTFYGLYFDNGITTIGYNSTYVPQIYLDNYIALHTPYVDYMYPDGLKRFYGSALPGYNLNYMSEDMEMDLFFQTNISKTIDQANEPLNFTTYEHSYGTLHGSIVLDGKTYTVTHGEGYMDHMIPISNTGGTWPMDMHGWSWTEVTTKKYQAIVYAVRSLYDGYDEYTYKHLTLLNKHNGKVLADYSGDEITISETGWIIETDYHRKRPSVVAYSTSDLNVTINAESVINFNRSDPTAATGFVDFMAYQPENATIQYNSNIEEGSAFHEYLVTDMGVVWHEDTTPPTIQSITLDTYKTIPDATIHVTVEATDNVGVTSVTADGVLLSETGSTWEGDITAPTDTGDYTLTIRAEDEAGNIAETTVDYSVVKPSGSIGIGVDPRLTTVSTGDTALINIKLVSTESFDDIAYVYLTTECIDPSYQANLTWFNWTSKYIKVPKGEEVNVLLEVSIPSGEKGYKVFYAKLESTKWTPTAMDTGILYII